MIEYFKQLISDQFEASLCTLDACVAVCPPEHWEGRIGHCPFWRVAYHTLFFVDMYLSADEQSFVPPEFDRPGVHGLPADEAEASSEVPYLKDVVAAYIEHCRQKVRQTISAETQASLEKPSGFPWYPMSRGEHHLTSIRHIQHHAGQLCAYLRRHTDVEVDWIGKVPEQTG